MRSCERLVQHHLAALELTYDLRGEVVRGRAETAASQHHVEPLRRHEPQRRQHVLAAVADDRDVRQVHAELLQTLRQPRAVAVGHATRQHLRAGHHDARARLTSHLHVGCSPAGSGALRRPRDRVADRLRGGRHRRAACR